MSSSPVGTVLYGADDVPVGVIYDFEKAGDCLAQHVHEYNVNDHFTVVAAGRIKVSSGYVENNTFYWEKEHDAVAENGPVLNHKPLVDPDTGLPGKYVVHEFTALTDGARIVNIRKGAIFGSDYPRDTAIKE